MKLYLAGPLFSTAELMFNRELARWLRGLGHKVFLPQESEENLRKLPSSNAIFQSDVAGIDWADVIVACLDGADPDSGTSWELGYAFAKDKASIVYRTDFRLHEGPDKINLMLTEGADSVVLLTPPDVELLAKRLNFELAIIADRRRRL